MKRVTWIVSCALLAVAGLLFGRPDRSHATGDNTMYVELWKPAAEGQPCAALPNLRVDLIEDGVTTTHYTEGNGRASFAVSTPVEEEVLTIKYYRSNGTLAGTTSATIQAGQGASDPWIFGEGKMTNDDCEDWTNTRTVHLVFNPS